MYWVLFRFGIVQYAVRLLREIASEYVICTNVPFEEWEILYGSCFLSQLRVDGDSLTPEPPQTPSPESVKGVIRSLIGEGAFKRVLVGGPFGIEGQLFLTRRSPRFEF